MENFDAAKAIFSQVDTDHDLNIDLDEFRNWTLNAPGLSTSPSDLSVTGVVFTRNMTTGQAETSRYEAGSQATFESSSGINNLYEGAEASSGQTDDAPIHTTSEQETSEYISRSAKGVYNDPNPQIIRRAAIGEPILYQQKIFVRFLQPPPIPPPGPLIIKEVRPSQPPPPPPLLVRQRPPPLPTPPPLILRERPPIPPTPVPSQTVIRHLNPIPVPPRTVVIERLPPLPPKPRDVIIERWIPYGPRPKRRTVVQRAPPSTFRYPQPRNIIVAYDPVEARVVRQFQRLGVTPENPHTYITRYGPTLLDAATLVQQARAAGVLEDLSPPSVSSPNQFRSSTSFSVGSGRTATGSDFSPSNTAGFEGLQAIDEAEASSYGLETANTSSGRYSSSTTSFVGESALGNRPSFDITGTSFDVADSNRDGQLDRAEFERFIQGGI